MSNIVDQLPEDIKDEFEVDDQDRVFAKSIRALSRLTGVAVSVLSDGRKNGNGEPKGLLNKLNIDTTGKEKVSLEIVLKLLQHYAFQSKEQNVVAYRNYFRVQNAQPPTKDTLINSKSNIKRQIKLTEKIRADALANELSGRREVITLGGKIDVLTSQQVIEVKIVKDWKSALGQVLVYGRYYPSHQKRIHLFGETQEKYLELIRAHCDEFDVLVTWEP